MSTALASRVMANIKGRLEAAATAAEPATINHSLVADFASGLADHLFLQLAAEPFTEADLVEVIAFAFGGLIQFVANGFATCGVWDRRSLQGYRETAERTFLDRIDALLSTLGTGGRA